MVAISKLLSSALLSAIDLNGSVSQWKLSMLEMEASLVNFRCTNIAVNHGVFVISQANAVAAMNAAPFATAQSGYPHEFKNLGVPPIRFAMDQCNRLKLQEFPVLTGGAIYNAHNHHPRDDPGPARVIYTVERQPAGHKLFCGVVAHVGAPGFPNQGHLQICTV